MDQSSTKPTIKLADFGDAVQLNTTYYIHQLLGNPEFAAPEIILGNPVSLTSDVWSIGVLTYVLLSGVSPFLDESVEETCLNICRLDFSFPDDYFKGVSQKAKDFVCFLLQDDPAKRPSAALALQEQWLQLGNSKSDDSIDISRLTSFIERRKHQNDVRPIRSIKNFLQSRLLPRVWPCLKFSLILFHLPINQTGDGLLLPINQTGDRLLLPISCWLEFWGKQTPSQPAASECSCANAFHRDPRGAARGTGDADFTGVEDNSTVLCKKQSRAIQQQYFIQVSAKKNSFFNKQELNFASELSYRFQDLFKKEMPMFKALVLNKNQIMPGEDSPKWLPIGTASIYNIWFSLGPRAFQLPRLYVSHVAVHWDQTLLLSASNLKRFCIQIEWIVLLW